MPYVPLCLLLATGSWRRERPSGWRCLALAWGVQITIGHFQIQMWTAALVLVMRRLEGAGRRTAQGPLAGAGCRPRLGRGRRLGAVSADMGTDPDRRASPGLRVPVQLPVPARALGPVGLAGVYLGRPPISGDPYWGGLGTTPEEACAYVGIGTLILACLGVLAIRRGSILAPWRWIAPAVVRPGHPAAMVARGLPPRAHAAGAGLVPGAGPVHRC